MSLRNALSGGITRLRERGVTISKKISLDRPVIDLPKVIRQEMDRAKITSTFIRVERLLEKILEVDEVPRTKVEETLGAVKRRLGELRKRRTKSRG